MATARLRKAFRYPADSDLDPSEPPEGVDEQEQERQISDLILRDALSNAFYRKVFLAVPVLALTCYLSSYLVRTPITGSRTAHPVLAALAVVASLLSLATIYDIPSSGIEASSPYNAAGSRRWARGYQGMFSLFRQTASTSYGGGVRSKHVGNLARLGAPPRVADWLYEFNAFLCTAMSLGASFSSWGLVEGTEESAWIALLPAYVSFFAVFVAVSELQKLDAKSLENLKYEYKGA